MKLEPVGQNNLTNSFFADPYWSIEMALIVQNLELKTEFDTNEFGYGFKICIQDAFSSTEAKLKFRQRQGQNTQKRVRR